ncbi:uncharacterized protein LOC126740434 [Anthonomus grandis grandis]|uniref:uncharacterized protein LOC126740434 n=1 Tax=Anthonomus grandis grandis TaxID=2921223 RepID=UPI0021656C35|nr:uncharacterized protein LOC126740434 [Anthonomus grandis grandis]
MGNLPEQRLNPSHPFDVVGVDYAGPFLIKNHTGRGAKVSKCYVALYICFLTKAVHLELVTSLSKDAFIKKISRKGKPSTIFSDNGTNELKELSTFFIKNNLELITSASNEGIDWHFIPPQSPHFGGLWEAGVKSMKSHLKRVVGGVSLTFEQLYTLLVEIEAIMNSRPLSPISSDPEDLAPLTPGHFIIGKQLSPVPGTDVIDGPVNRLTIYQHLQQMKQHIWKRWMKEYIAELQQRSKWRLNYDSLKEGVLVLIKDDNLPPMKWKLGRVLTVFLGKDKVSRVALVKTDRGNITRCFSKLCPLPLSNLV